MEIPECLMEDVQTRVIELFDKAKFQIFLNLGPKPLIDNSWQLNRDRESKIKELNKGFSTIKLSSISKTHKQLERSNNVYLLDEYRELLVKIGFTKINDNEYCGGFNINADLEEINRLYEKLKSLASQIREVRYSRLRRYDGNRAGNPSFYRTIF